MLKIKNKDLLSVYNLLIELKLPFKDSRLRTKFAKLIAEHNDVTYVAARQEIIDDLCTTTEEGKFIAKGENAVKLQNELNVLENEYFKLECNNVNKEMLLKVNEVLHNEELFDELSGEQALIHETICEEFERIEQLYEN